jgi:hypothetical protein
MQRSMIVWRVSVGVGGREQFLTYTGRNKIGDMNTSDLNYGGYHDLLITADSEGRARFRCK